MSVHDILLAFWEWNADSVEFVLGKGGLEVSGGLYNPRLESLPFPTCRESCRLILDSSRGKLDQIFLYADMFK